MNRFSNNAGAFHIEPVERRQAQLVVEPRNHERTERVGIACAGVGGEASQWREPAAQPDPQQQPQQREQCEQRRDRPGGRAPRQPVAGGERLRDLHHAARGTGGRPLDRTDRGGRMKGLLA